MISSIKNFFGGILSFLIGLFGGKKSQEDKPGLKAAEKPAAKNQKRSGYFMELDESEDTQLVNSVQAAKDAALKTLESAKNATSKTLESAKDATSKTLETAKDGAAKAIGTAKDTTSKTLESATPAKSNKPEPVAAAKSTKKEAAKTPEPAAAAQAAKVELIQTAEAVKAVPAKPPSDNGQKPAETTFAPKYLAPTSSSNSRRRPGPNMNPFLDMARQVKTPG